MAYRFAAAILFCAAPALAQGGPMAMSRAASANQLGVLEYCQQQGYVDPAAVTAQRSVNARLPPAPTDAAATDAAEALGRQGTISANSNTVTLADMATRSSTTVDALCKRMASSVIQTATMFQSGMPSLPAGMPSMPAMPGGMPVMPGVVAPSR